MVSGGLMAVWCGLMAVWGVSMDRTDISENSSLTELKTVH